MCFSKTINHNSSTDYIAHGVARINGRPVLQPTCNRVPPLERRSSLKKTPQNTLCPAPVATTSPNKSSAFKPPTSKNRKSSATRTTGLSPSPPISPKTRSPKQQLINHGLSPSIEKMSKGSKNSSSTLIVQGPQWSIATARREQVASMQELRKMRTARYGKKKFSANKGESKEDLRVDSLKSTLVGARNGGHEEKRCSFITPNSDPVYVAYHDEEWGVPVHDDRMLFEWLVLTAAQVGSDWTSILKKRVLFRDAFSGFDAEQVASFGERKITSISHDCGMELCHVRGTVDNANQILKIKNDFGSFNNYLWRFVNNKPISTNYKTSQKIPVKTSKSEAISKDLVTRGFRYVGPTVIHSFMQAAGFTNDHLITCPRHLLCS